MVEQTLNSVPINLTLWVFLSPGHTDLELLWAFFFFFKEGSEQMNDNSHITQHSLCFARQAHHVVLKKNEGVPNVIC